MSKTDGKKTKQKILKTAEKLFSNEGYDGTSVDRIAREAGVNKGAIYYHFKNKEDILNKLFNMLSKEILELISSSMDSIHSSNHSPEAFDRQMKEMLRFIEKRKKIINIMFMESLKESNKNFSLFECADIMINDEIKGILKKHEEAHEKTDLNKKEFQVREFFTGFIPIVTFAIFREKYAQFLNFNSNMLTETFLKAFRKTHLASQFTGERKN